MSCKRGRAKIAPQNNRFKEEKQSHVFSDYMSLQSSAKQERKMTKFKFIGEFENAMLKLP